jgi:hypothetical protein
MTVTYALNVTVNNVEVCAAMDGVSGNPNCAHQFGQYDSTSAVAREQLNISQGSHTIATTVSTTGGGMMLGWETDYTIYGIK